MGTVRSLTWYQHATRKVEVYTNDEARKQLDLLAKAEFLIQRIPAKAEFLIRGL